MKKIIWLTSYPKSGNTWCRTFLTNLTLPENEVAIDKLIAPIVSSRQKFDEYLCCKTTEMTNEEIENLTPYVLRRYAGEITHAPFFMKMHDAYTYTGNGMPLIPSDISLGTVYIVRNPLDVAVSYAHHNNEPVDVTIGKMNDDTFAIENNPEYKKLQVKQNLKSWTSHVQGWNTQKDIPVLMIRYEDMLMDAYSTFRRIADFCGIEASEEEIIHAVEKSSFENVKKQEAEFGFREKSPKNDFFFRKGQSGSWRESLSAQQAQAIISEHADMMMQLGYLDASGNPVY